MRAEAFQPTDHEVRMQYSTFGATVYPPDIVQDELADFPLPRDKKPTAAGMPGSW